MATEASSSRIPEILFVDNDPRTVFLYTDIFRDNGYHLHFAENAQQGFEQARHMIPDMIFGNAGLLIEKNALFIQKIRQDQYLHSTVIIIVSDKAASQDTNTIKQVDIDDHITKPLNRKEILLKIPFFLQIRSLRDRLVKSERNINGYRQARNIYKQAFEKQKTTLLENRDMLGNSLRQISMMIEEREQLSKTISTLKKTLDDHSNGLIALLSSAIESKRQYHREHAGRVADISTFIAHQLKLPEKQIRQIETAARLHEIGKLSMPDDLTMKSPLQYTLSERHFINLHPVSGAAVLQNFPGFSSAANIVRHIHENVDGTGIPDKLKKTDIPIGSRIIAVANIFENLVYQNRTGTVENAFRIIDNMINTRFDSKVVYHLHQYAELNPVNDKNRTEAINLYELKPGMELAASIYTRKGAILLPIKTILTEDAINRIALYAKEDPIEKTIFIR